MHKIIEMRYPSSPQGISSFIIFVNLLQKHVDWGTLGAFTKMQYTRTSVTVPVYMRMKAEDTDKVVTAVYDYNYIPQGVLQD